VKMDGRHEPTINKTKTCPNKGVYRHRDTKNKNTTNHLIQGTLQNPKPLGVLF
jgi:thiamine phosphate synthase YjbQ (UPF0047 family)